MYIRGLIIISMLELVACRPVSPGSAAPWVTPQTTQYLDLQAGFSVEVPNDWEQQDQGITQIFHGPKDTDAYFATLAIQRHPASGPTRLDETIAHTLAALSQAPGFAWDTLEIAYIGANLAVGYSVRFNALDIAYCQNGLVFLHNGYIVGMTLSAPSASCPAVAPVFQQAVDSLTTYSPKQPASAAAHVIRKPNPHLLRPSHDSRSRR